MKKILVTLYQLLRNIFHFIRLDVFLMRPNYHYVPDFYGHTAFKHVDIRSLPVFGDLAKAIIEQGSTSLYFDRLYIIFQAIRNISHLQPNRQGLILAEVGVYKGGTSKFIVSVAHSFSIPFRLYGFDTFEGHTGIDISDIDGDHVPSLFGDTSLEAVSAYLDDPSITLYKGRFQDTCTKFEQTIFHFVHLDVDLYEPTMQALKFFADRMAQGGIILVDDYGFSTCLGIEKAVWEFLATRSDFLSFHVLSGQMILIKR